MLFLEEEFVSISYTAQDANFVQYNNKVLPDVPIEKTQQSQKVTSRIFPRERII